MLFFKRVKKTTLKIYGVKPTCKQKGYTLVYVGVNRCVYAVNKPNYGCVFAKVKTKHKRTILTKVVQAKRIAKKQSLHLVLSVV